MEPLQDQTERSSEIRWGKVVDHESCIGCHACSTACKAENEVPLSVNRTYVKYVDVGEFPEARRAFQVTRCNQCADSPCATACPTSAMFARDDGIVDFDKSICIGCKACMAACPYDAIFINPDDHSAEKCNFCAHRVDSGLEPACVVVCPTEAIMIGDMNDPGSRVAQMVHREAVTVRRPEKETGPKLFYRGAHQATLDPLAARRPEGGLFMWSEQLAASAEGGSGGRDGGRRPSRTEWPNSSAAALLSYDVPHRIPWDWRVSLYTLTKSIATGAFLVGSPEQRPGGLAGSASSPSSAMLFLALTGVLLLADLEHPKRFYLIFTRPQWKSWLVSGAFIIAAYSALPRALLPGALVRGLAGTVPRPCRRRSSRPRPRSTRRTSSPRPRRATSGRARSCRPHLLVQALAGRKRHPDPRAPSFLEPSAVGAAEPDPRRQLAGPPVCWSPARSPCRTAPPTRRSRVHEMTNGQLPPLVLGRPPAGRRRVSARLWASAPAAGDPGARRPRALRTRLRPSRTSGAPRLGPRR